MNGRQNRNSEGIADDATAASRQAKARAKKGLGCGGAECNDERWTYDSYLSIEPWAARADLKDARLAAECAACRAE